MAKTWKEALEDMSDRAREILAELGLLPPEPELVPVPVRNGNRRPRGDRSSR